MDRTGASDFADLDVLAAGPGVGEPNQRFRIGERELPALLVDLRQRHGRHRQTRTGTRPLAIQPVLETQVIDDATFRAARAESNRIWIGRQADGGVAGRPCRQQPLLRDLRQPAPLDNGARWADLRGHSRGPGRQDSDHAAIATAWP